MWLACAGMLLDWLLIAPTKTLRWSSVFRTFSVATLWALVLALIRRHLAGAIGLPVASAGPSIAIAAVMEETLKLIPLAIVAFLAPGRARRFVATDWALLRVASGMGFQAAEDFVRQATRRPDIFSLFGGRNWQTAGRPSVAGPTRASPATRATKSKRRSSPSPSVSRSASVAAVVGGGCGRWRPQVAARRSRPRGHQRGHRQQHRLCPRTLHGARLPPRHLVVDGPRLQPGMDSLFGARP